MKKNLLFLLLLIPMGAFAQSPIISNWILNTTGKTSSYWENTGGGQNPNYVYHTSTSLADVLKVCYDNDSVWVSSNGMTNDMGKYLNPGSCTAQNYVYRFPRNPTVPTTKTISPKIGSIGLLTNGIPIYGLSNANSWKASTSSNTNQGDRVWNVEVYLSEGFVLDTAFGAHPQQQGAYHSHATPWRLYKSSPSNVHSPIVGYAFDGYPVYGPYGYSDPNNTSSTVTRMKTGYSLRNIINRQSLPYGVTLNSNQYGPAINSTYPLGTYCEDYEWLASNGGDLDKYNGRFCKTPEYPQGTYAYFITMSSANVPQFPYYIGIEYYGAPDTKDITMGAVISMPTTKGTCLPTAATYVENSEDDYLSAFTISPNPANGSFTVKLMNEAAIGNSVNVFNLLGEKVYTSTISSLNTTIDLSNNVASGIYLIQLVDNEGQMKGIQKVIIRK